MTTATLDHYYQRMSSALGDKKRVLPYIKGKTVLDIGCGSGDLLNVLLEEKNLNAFGIDPSPESIERNKYQDRVFELYSDEIDFQFKNQFFDTIICSSVFHEVFSYGNYYTSPGKLQSLSDALRSIYHALKPGGRLIVRDGVAPDFQGEFTMQVDNPSAVYKFLDASPFSRGNTPLDRNIHIKYLGDGVFKGTASSLMEFAFTYTWGVESFDREVQEYYGIFTLDEYRSFVENHGFYSVFSCKYTQPEYITHLEGKVKFDMPFPSTNALWVYDKEK